MPPDVPACVPEGSQAYCDNTISDHPFHVDNSGQDYVDSKGKHYNYDQLKLISLILPVESWASVKAYILAQCKKNKNCANIQPQIEKFEKHLRLGEYEQAILDSYEQQ